MELDKDLKDALEGARKAHADFKATNEVAEKERKDHGRVMAATQEKMDKMQAAMDSQMEAAQKRWDAIERRVNRGELFGGASDKVEALALEVKAFNRQTTLMPGRGVERKPLAAEDYVKLYKPAFDAYLRGGKAAVDSMSPEFRAVLSVGSDPAGGYQVPVDITDDIFKLAYETSPLRQRARQRSTSRDRIQIKRSLDKATNGGWVSERGSRGVTGTQQVPVPYEIPVHAQYAFPSLSQQDLDDSDMDMGSWLREEASEQFGRDENTSFVLGNGVGKPRGFATYPSGVPSKSNPGQVERVSTLGATGFAAAPNGPDIFINLIGKMKTPYIDGCSWAMTRSTLAAARTLKDSQGHYQVQITPGLQGRPGFEVLGFPIDLFADMDELGASKLPIALANWKEAYLIVDHTSGLSLLVDPYTAKPDVGFYMTKRVGGDIRNPEAIKLAVCSGS